MPNFKVKAYRKRILLGLPNMKTWHERLRHALEQRNMRPKDLSDKVKVKPASVSDWLSGETKKIEGENLIRVCDALNINAKWLIFGIGDSGLNFTANQDLANYTLIDSDQQITSVPLLSWVQAGDFMEAIEDFTGERIATDAKVNKSSYALRVVGDSMMPVFPPGTILIIDPEMVAISGDYVIAKNGDNEATFKQLIKDGSDWYLKPVNPQYPIKSAENTTIIGVVIQSQLVTKHK